MLTTIFWCCLNAAYICRIIPPSLLSTKQARWYSVSFVFIAQIVLEIAFGVFWTSQNCATGKCNGHRQAIPKLHIYSMSWACSHPHSVLAEVVSCMFSYSASLMSIEISLCSLPQENEMSAGFTLPIYQHFIHRSILVTSLSLLSFSLFFLLHFLSQYYVKSGKAL